MSERIPTALRLANRERLPEALRCLVGETPREAWEANPNFAGLVAFWLDRHMMFRRLCETLSHDAEQAIDGGLASETHRQRLTRFGGMLLQELHGHHSIEDHHYFPKLIPLSKGLERGFDILDADHHDLDPLMAGFAEVANATLQGGEAGPLLEEVSRFQRLLERHLEDEEDLIVPVILKVGPEAVG